MCDVLFEMRVLLNTRAQDKWKPNWIINENVKYARMARAKAVEMRYSSGGARKCKAQSLFNLQSWKYEQKRNSRYDVEHDNQAWFK